MRTINHQKSKEKREMKISKFDPTGFEPTHVPDKGLTYYKGYVQRPISSLFEGV